MKRDDDEIANKIEGTAAAISAALMAEGGPSFAGAVLTLSLGHVLALMDEKQALKTATMHFSRAMEFRKFVRARMDKLKAALTEEVEREIAKEESKHASHH